MTEQLKPCPFCGGKVHLGICDDEGNPRNELYEQDPWSGLTFHLMHTYEENETCPIALYEGDERGLGIHLYESKEEAIDAWNRRQP